MKTSGWRFFIFFYFTPGSVSGVIIFVVTSVQWTVFLSNESMKRIKSEIIIVAILICVTILLLIRKNSEETRLKQEGVFVIGRLFNSSFGGGQGWVYDYEYYYADKKYVRSFTGPIGEAMLSDSVMFFKILPKKPKVCRQVLNNRVPECFRRKEFESRFWTAIPSSCE